MKQGDEVMVKDADGEQWKGPLTYVCECLYTGRHYAIGRDSVVAILWDEAKPVEKEIRVKKASVVVNQLEDDGYVADRSGHWGKGGEVNFLASMFYYCGKKPDAAHTWPEKWLEEVEV